MDRDILSSVFYTLAVKMFLLKRLAGAPYITGLRVNCDPKMGRSP